MKNEYEKTKITGETRLNSSTTGTHFFYSADGYDEFGNKIVYVHGLMGFGTKETEKMMKDPFKFILEAANDINANVVSVHILSLNKV